jgi:subtilase family serine protease
VSDAAVFNSQFGLQQFNVAGGPTLTVRNQTGGTALPTNSGASGWSVEESLDVQWAHAIAPQANIVLFEANSASMSDLMTAVQAAAAHSGVSVVSMGWGTPEFPGETSYDSYFTTPNVTFLASTGDSGSPGQYPAYSPNVVAVGGTTLTLGGNNYGSETGWSGSGGGQSSYESEPSYQAWVQNSGMRETPDVSFDADSNTGAAVYDSYDYGRPMWMQVGGTGLSASCWAGLIAITDQFRLYQGIGLLGGLSRTLPALYSIGDFGDFNDVTSGSNGGYSAGSGYDMVTGLGTPAAEGLMYDLALDAVADPATTASLSASTSATQYGQPITFTATVNAVDQSAGVQPTGPVVFMDGGAAIGVALLSGDTAILTDSSLGLV